MNTDRICENCGHDWRGDAECPVCMHTATLVTICGWCPNARERTAAAIAAGHTVSHGICERCVPLFTADPLSPKEAQDAHLATFGRGK